MIRLDGTRFGTIELPDDAAIEFPRGIIGFNDETSFAIVERDKGIIGYLQSLKTPGLALPIIDGALLRPNYPQTSPEELARSLGIDPDHLALLVVVHVDPDDRSLRANLLAPIAIDAQARRAQQIILDPDHYSPSAKLGSKSTPQDHEVDSQHVRPTPTASPQ